MSVLELILVAVVVVVVVGLFNWQSSDNPDDIKPDWWRAIKVLAKQHRVVLWVLAAAFFALGAFALASVERDAPQAAPITRAATTTTVPLWVTEPDSPDAAAAYVKYKGGCENALRVASRSDKAVAPWLSILEDHCGRKASATTTTSKTASCRQTAGDIADLNESVLFNSNLFIEAAALGEATVAQYSYDWMKKDMATLTAKSRKFFGSCEAAFGRAELREAETAVNQLQRSWQNAQQECRRELAPLGFDC